MFPTDDEAVLEKVIMKRIMLQEAEKVGITVSDEEILAKIKESRESRTENAESGDEDAKKGLEKDKILFEAFSMTQEEYEQTIQLKTEKETEIQRKYANYYMENLFDTEQISMVDYLKHKREAAEVAIHS